MSSTPYLLDEKVISLSPTLAAAIGVNEALVLQQIHYWIDHNAHDKDKAKTHYKLGKWWTWNTYEQWRSESFTFWSKRTIERVMANLEGMCLVVSQQFDSYYGNMHKWYSIDYDMYSYFLMAWSDAGKPIEGTKAYKEFLQEWLLVAHVCQFLDSISSHPSRQVVIVDDDNLSSSSRQSVAFITDSTTDNTVTHKKTSIVSLNQSSPFSVLLEDNLEQTPPSSSPVAPAPSSPPKKRAVRTTQSAKKAKYAVEDSDRVLDELERTIGTALLRWHIKTMPWSQEQVGLLDRVRLQLQVHCEDKQLQLDCERVMSFVNWYYDTHKDNNGIPWNLPKYDKLEGYFSQYLDTLPKPRAPRPEGAPVQFRARSART